MDQWLEAIENDSSGKSLAEKVVDDKPAGLTDRCYSGVGVKLYDNLCPGLLVTLYGTPRTAAGQPRTTDINKCQLKPLDRDDYPQFLTDAQFAALEEIFPEGVCDFSKPGVEQQDTIPWQTYQEEDGRVIYGGKPMDAPPVSIPFDPPVDPTPVVATCGGVEATIVGTSSSETITGTAGNDVIQAFRGNDVVDGGGGNDRICGSGGKDQLTGGTGKDVLSGGTEDDKLRGGGGDDYLVGNDGADELYGESQNDTLIAKDGVKDIRISGGTGTDTATRDSDDPTPVSVP
jgi:hypothetical protein